MRGSDFRICLLFAFLTFAAVANLADAVFWFQTGAFGTNKAEFNNGASVSIQTVWQNVSDGSMGFWVGETLSNGAFIQVGYQIVNQTGDYPAYCDRSGCNGTTFLTAGAPTWFWEYFPVNDQGSTFYGGIGSDASVGVNGTFNTYSFRSNGNVWTAYFNDQLIGSVDLGTPQSGVNPPTAIGELAATSENDQQMQKVMFRNLQFYSDHGLSTVPTAYSMISYGKGSDTWLRNPYGVSEVDSLVNNFAVGSGLSQQNRSTLWDIGYSLRIVSPYGNLSGVSNYSAYSTAVLHAPRNVSLGNGTRANFIGWRGAGQGAYTGSNINATVNMYNNMTETAVWGIQYYVGVNSTYGTYGSGWYDANSTAKLRANSMIDFGNGTRVVFAGWSDGVKTNSTTVHVSNPLVMGAFWTTQYRINATTPYGSVQGAGWYDKNSTVTLQLNETVVPVSLQTRLGFYRWSNGYTNSTISFVANASQSLSAVFRAQYLVTLEPENVFGNAIYNVEYYDIDGMNTRNNSLYLFENGSYTVNYIYYKGVKMLLNHPFVVSMPETVKFEAQLYDVQISAVSALGEPVNASLNLTFDNGTRMVSYLGGAGSINLTNVPYGHVYGYVEYFGVKKSVSLAGGAVSILFITPSLIAVTIVAIAAIVLSGRFVKSRYS